jgi:hypothetical protein
LNNKVSNDEFLIFRMQNRFNQALQCGVVYSVFGAKLIHQKKYTCGVKNGLKKTPCVVLKKISVLLEGFDDGQVTCHCSGLAFRSDRV